MLADIRQEFKTWSCGQARFDMNSVVNHYVHDITSLRCDNWMILPDFRCIPVVYVYTYVHFQFYRRLLCFSDYQLAWSDNQYKMVKHGHFLPCSSWNNLIYDTLALNFINNNNKKNQEVFFIFYFILLVWNTIFKSVQRLSFSALKVWMQF